MAALISNISFSAHEPVDDKMVNSDFEDPGNIEFWDDALLTKMDEDTLNNIKIEINKNPKMLKRMSTFHREDIIFNYEYHTSPGSSVVHFTGEQNDWKLDEMTRD